MTEAEKIICRLYLEDMDKNHTCNEYRLLMELLDRVPCEDTISRQAAIDAIELITWYHQNRNREMVKGANSQEDQAWYKAEDVYKVLNDLPSAESAWIPCSERLPEEGQRVLATHLGGLNPERQVIEHIYSDGKFLHGWEMDMDVDSPTFGQRYMGDVIAWMSLPEPYKAERRTDEQ